jgi:hypothetical protein
LARESAVVHHSKKSAGSAGLGQLLTRAMQRGYAADGPGNSLNDLVGHGEQPGRKGEIKRLCSFEIYHKLKLVRLHYWQVSGLGAL